MFLVTIIIKHHAVVKKNIYTFFLTSVQYFSHYISGANAAVGNSCLGWEQTMTCMGIYIKQD